MSTREEMAAKKTPIPDARDAEIDVRTVLIMVMSSAQMEKDGHNWLTCDSPSCVLARQAIFPKPQGGA